MWLHVRVLQLCSAEKMYRHPRYVYGTYCDQNLSLPSLQNMLHTVPERPQFERVWGKPFRWRQRNWDAFVERGLCLASPQQCLLVSPLKRPGVSFYWFASTSVLSGWPYATTTFSRSRRKFLRFKNLLELKNQTWQSNEKEHLRKWRGLTNLWESKGSL